MHLREDARVFQVADADVVRSQREPGAIRFENALGNLVTQPDEISRAAENARARIQAIDDVQRSRCFFRQHHQAAHAGVRSRSRIPMRLLITDRREQAPIDADFRRRLAKPMSILRQARFDVLHEHARLDVIESIGAAVVRVENRSESPFRARRRKERRDALEQTRIARSRLPMPAPCRPTNRKRCGSPDETRGRSRIRWNRRRCNRTRAATIDTTALRFRRWDSPPSSGWR